MSRPSRTSELKEGALPFDEAAQLLKALGHPLRLKLVCGLSREPSNLTRIVAALDAPLSTVALHLAVLRRVGILKEARQGAEVRFQLRDQRVREILGVFCRIHGEEAPESWGWRSLGSDQPLHRN
jgi:ArsR family transcriptional regulator